MSIDERYDFKIDVNNKNESHSICLNMIEDNSVILEFGTAKGIITEYLKQSKKCKVYGVEIDEQFATQAARFTNDLCICDIESYDWIDKFRDIKFDYILFMDVLEHLKDPIAVLEKTKCFISDKTKLIISIPNIAHNAVIMSLLKNDFLYSQSGILDQTHLKHFTYNSIVNTLNKLGLNIYILDATYASPMHAGLNQSYEKSNLWLLSKKYGHVFQFILCAGYDKSIITDNRIKSYNISDFYAQLFWSVDECSFCQENSLVNSLKIQSDILKVSFGLEEVNKLLKKIRIDPINTKAIISNIKISLVFPDDKSIEIYDYKTNASLTLENIFIFNVSDPQIVIDTTKTNLDQAIYIRIEAKILALDEIVDEYMQIIDKVLNVKDIEIKQKENIIYETSNRLKEEEEKIEEISNRLREKEEKIEEISNRLREKEKEIIHIVKHYNAVINSTCWRMTKPLRIFVGWMKKILETFKLGRLIFKGLSYWRSQGFRRLVKKLRLKYGKKKLLNKDTAHYKISLEDRRTQEMYEFKRHVKISILVPLYNTPEKYLREMINSVKGQTYRNWELCLADSSDSCHTYIRKICLSEAKNDKRILYKVLESNDGISENTNQCIGMSTGEYLGLLDHDDLLHPSALFEVMKVINEGNADFIYTDENTFSETPEDAYCPHFKPDFAPDTLRTQNYICHFTVFSRNLINKAGMLRKQFDGSQDFDLVLRLTENAKHIVHIPQILYFWRAHRDSVALNIGAKPYALIAAKKAISEHLERVGLEGAVLDSVVPSTYRIKYKIYNNPLISIIIPNKDHYEDLEKCIESILEKTSYKNYEILIIDNGSETLEIFQYYEHLQTTYNEVRVFQWNNKFNYSSINNFGFKLSRGEYIILLNNDTEIITSDWIQEMLMFAQRPDVGAVGAKLYYPDDTIQHAGVIIGLLTVAGHSHRHCKREHFGYMGRVTHVQNVSAVTAACMMVPRGVYEKLNGLDESFEIAFNDIDFCMRIRKAGYLIVFTPYSELYHYESKSRGLEDTLEKQKRFQGEIIRFQKRWKNELKDGDPYYNPNLTLDAEDFSIKEEI